MQTPTKTSTWCRTLGCYNYGNPQNRNLCNSCYQKLSERCPIRNCSNFGNKNTHGLCNECSKRFRFCTKCKRFGRPLPGDDTDAPVCLCDQNLLNPNEVRNDPVNGNWKPCKHSSCDNVSRDEEQFGLCMQCSDRFGFCKTCYGFFSAVPDFLINGHVCICEPKTNTNKPTDGDKGHISLAGNTVIVCKNRECTNYGSNKNAGLCYECAGLFKFCRTCQGFRVAVPSSVFNERWCSCVSATRDSTAEITTQGSGTNLNNTEAHVPAHVKSPETLRPIPPVETSNSLKYGMSELGYSSDITQRNLSCRGNSVTQRPVSGEVIYRECSESDCHKTGLESLGGRCATCYTLFKCVERNELKKSTQVAHKEILCSVPECNRPVSADLDGRCLYCHEAGRNGPQSQTSNSGLPHSFIESALGQQCATVPSKCTTPSCDRQVFRNCKCFSCYKELGKPCIVEGCLYFGSPDYHGKCSTCYNTNDVTSTFSMRCFPSASANITNDTPVTKKECSTPSCGFYGHPQQLDLCSECFQKHLSADVNPSRPSELSISREHQSSIPVLSIPYDSDFTSACARLGRLTIVSSPCQSECGNSCTTDTFPYCMECFNKFLNRSSSALMSAKPLKQEVATTNVNVSSQSGQAITRISIPPEPAVLSAFRNMDESASMSSISSDQLFSSLNGADEMNSKLPSDTVPSTSLPSDTVPSKNLPSDTVPLVLLPSEQASEIQTSGTPEPLNIIKPFDTVRSSGSHVTHSSSESTLGQTNLTMPFKCTTPKCVRLVYRNCKCFMCYRELGKPCIVEGCPFFGSPDYEGKCSKCCNENNASVFSSMLQLPSALANITNNIHVTEKKCSTPNCSFYGDPEKMGLCTFCFNKRLQAMLNPGRPSELPVSGGLPSSTQTQSMPFDSNSSVFNWRPQFTASTTDATVAGASCVSSYTTDTLPPSETRFTQIVNQPASAPVFSVPPAVLSAFRNMDERASVSSISSDQLFSSLNGADEMISKLPSDTVTSTSLPSETVPSTNLPSDTVLSTNLPSEPVPSTNLPSEPVPSTNLPSEQTNEVKLSGTQGSVNTMKPTDNVRSPDTVKSPSTEKPSDTLKSPDKVKLSVVSKTFSRLEADDVICLWTKPMMTVGPIHPILQHFRPSGDTSHVLGPWTDFKNVLQCGRVKETTAGGLNAKRMLHCLCSNPSPEGLFESLKKTIDVARQSSVVILPFCVCDVMYNNPRPFVSACLKLVWDLQKQSQPQFQSQSLKKVIIAVGNEETEDLLKGIIDEKNKLKRLSGFGNQKGVCKSCNRKSVAKLGTLSRNCDEDCRWFCVDCLKRSHEIPLVCTLHGPCLSPIGHENTFALLIAGQDDKRESATIFIRDTNSIAEALKDSDIIGIRNENLKVITIPQPGDVDEKMKDKVIEAFQDLRIRMQGKEHTFFILYFSGHNSQKSLRLGGRLNRISPKELRKELRALDADNILIILDCCYSAGAELSTYDDEDFTTSIGHVERTDSGSFVLVPKLWNLRSKDDDDDDDDDDSGAAEAKRDVTRVKQWASSVAAEQSFFHPQLKQSFFTHSLLELLNGRCPARLGKCDDCVRYHAAAADAECVYLQNLHQCVGEHVVSMVEGHREEQHPQLSGTDEDDITIAFHLHS